MKTKFRSNSELLNECVNACIELAANECASENRFLFGKSKEADSLFYTQRAGAIAAYYKVAARLKKLKRFVDEEEAQKNE